MSAQCNGCSTIYDKVWRCHNCGYQFGKCCAKDTEYMTGEGKCKCGTWTTGSAG